MALILFALLDPDLRLSVGSSTPAKVLIFRDISSSMDLRDDGSSTRSERTAGLIHEIESAAPASVRFEVIPFDSVVHAEGCAPRGDEDARHGSGRRPGRAGQPAEIRRRRRARSS